jgi:hypothetical protein
MPWTARSGKPVEGGKEFPSLSKKCHGFGPGDTYKLAIELQKRLSDEETEEGKKQSLRQKGESSR